jgi:hypothetical protein
MFIHEQLHWWLDQKTEELIKAKAELKILYPSLPDVGIAKDTESSYLHFIICSLEYELLIHYLGLKQANINRNRQEEFIFLNLTANNVHWVYQHYKIG